MRVEYEPEFQFISQSFLKYPVSSIKDGRQRTVANLSAPRMLPEEEQENLLLNAVGSKTGAQLRSAIMQERDQLINAGREEAPRDSEMSAGKYQEDYDKVRQARVRVQNRLL